MQNYVDAQFGCKLCILAVLKGSSMIFFWMQIFISLVKI